MPAENSSIGETFCSYISGHSMSDCGRKSRCIQRYNFQHLLAVDPGNLHSCPTIRAFKFPSSCVCHIDYPNHHEDYYWTNQDWDDNFNLYHSWNAAPISEHQNNNKRETELFTVIEHIIFFVTTFPSSFSGFQDFLPSLLTLYRGFCNSQNIHVPTIYKTHPAMLEQ